MKKAFLVAAAALGLAACTFPQTKMEPVGETQMQTQQQKPDGQKTTSRAPASAQSASAAR